MHMNQAAAAAFIWASVQECRRGWNLNCRQRTLPHWMKVKLQSPVVGNPDISLFSGFSGATVLLRELFNLPARRSIPVSAIWEQLSEKSGKPCMVTNYIRCILNSVFLDDLH